jgi:hypothetical protein
MVFLNGVGGGVVGWGVGGSGWGGGEGGGGGGEVRGGGEGVVVVGGEYSNSIKLDFFI